MTIRGSGWARPIDQSRLTVDTHQIAVIPGDGVGPEVVAEARKSVDALALGIEWTELPWGTTYWHAQGVMMPDDGVELLQGFDAVFLGAVGEPSVPDHITVDIGGSASTVEVGDAIAEYLAGAS